MVNKQILRLALPSMVSNITVPLLALVDVAIVGHLGAAAYIGAIAVGGTIFNVIYWVFGFLRMGTSGLTSQALGRRDLTEVVALLLRSIGISLAVALCFILFQRLLLDGALWLMHPSPQVATLASVYFGILIWGAPAMLGMFSVTGWLIGMQNTRLPMLVAIVQNVANIAVSMLLVFVFGMKIEGVAYGTLIAQYVSLLLALVLSGCVYGRLQHYQRWPRVWLRSSLRQFFKVNRDIFLRTLCLVSVMLFFTTAGSWQGETVLAVNTLLMQFSLLFSYIMDGFAYAAEALSGKYFGAGNKAALRSTVHHLFRWGWLMAALFTLLYMVGGQSFLSLLTDEPSVVEASSAYYLWALALPVVGMAAYIWDGVHIGCTATRAMLLSMLLSAAAFFTAYGVSVRYMGNHGLWLAFLLFLAVRSVVLWRCWSKTMRKYKG